MNKVWILFAGATLLLSACVGNPEGKKAETTHAVEIAQTRGDSLVLDTATSKLLWEGHKVTGKHNGEVKISDGVLLLNEQGKLAGGSFIIDMTQIDVQDLSGNSREKLTSHLKSEDFFSVDTYPEARFEISAVQEQEQTDTLLVSGNLTLRGVTKNITFDTIVEESTAEYFAARADFNIEREDFDVLYAGKADDLISKEINIKINLKANKL